MKLKPSIGLIMNIKTAKNTNLTIKINLLRTARSVTCHCLKTPLLKIYHGVRWTDLHSQMLLSLWNIPVDFDLTPRE
jgi:hypothetical protein